MIDTKKDETGKARSTDICKCGDQRSFHVDRLGCGVSGCGCTKFVLKKDETATPENYVERDVTQAMNGLTVKRNHWWLCVDGDPKRALFWKVRSYKSQFDSPQCNVDKRIVEHLNEVPGVVPTFIPIAYVPPRG